MKFVFKGKYTREEQLPKAELPENAVRFNEPETPVQLNIMGTLFSLPPIVLMAGIAFLSSIWHGSILLEWSLWGVLIGFGAIIPHELIHAVNFPKDAEVEMYYSLKSMMMFVVSTAPVSKWKFIWLSFCPSLVLGWIPFVFWAFFPNMPVLSPILITFGVLNILFGAGDYMNMYNAWRQMPKGSLTQLSGFHSYWYIPTIIDKSHTTMYDYK